MLFLADDYRENFDQIIRDLSIPTNPSLYIHAPARLDASMAPAGEDTITAIVPVGHINEADEQDWAEMMDQARQAVFRRLAMIGVTDLEAHIKFEICYTPASWRKRYNLAKGSTHGLCHNLLQLGYFRPARRHARYHNLYFVGSSTHPGTGLPTALISARLTAQRMLDDFSLL
jgi:phytoene dehydrogenase-like protein